MLDRIAEYTPVVDGMGVDVLPYTEREFSELYRDGRTIIHTALAEGEWVIGPPAEFAGEPPSADGVPAHT